MADSIKPKVMVVGHSFVHRLHSFLRRGKDSHFEQDLGLGHTCALRFFGTGGRTVPKTCLFDCETIKSFNPDVVILELGSNDLTAEDARPETVGSALADLVIHLFEVMNTSKIFVCQILHRTISPRPSYNIDVDKLNKYLKTVVNDIPNACYWRHRGMLLPSQDIIAVDGVHLNEHGQYLLYQSYHGAVIQALKLLDIRITT
ncbi:hypothetical protein OS493_000377 [Desmophyllum pertusum]|uniref:SGNH hydrolase-type esterase domain-containing protein n=1 Tax=Desmophyllum pertusum TaxID=174260 RepID=A0A9X0A6X3_9CNID|nr:hypothetical protein OS493_000377 [Desmophyllum pertusum]